MNHTEHEEESQVEDEAVGAELEESTEHPIDGVDVESETEDEDSSPGLSAEELKRRHEEKKAKAIARKQRKRAEKASQENDLLKQRLAEIEARQEVASMTVSKRPDMIDYDTDEEFHAALDSHYAEKHAKEQAQKKYARKEPKQEQSAQQFYEMDEDAYELAAELEEERMDVDPDYEDNKAEFLDLLEANKNVGDVTVAENILQRAFLEEGEGEFDWCDAIKGLSKSKAGISSIVRAGGDPVKTAKVMKRYAAKAKPAKKPKAKVKQVQSRPEKQLTGSSSPSVNTEDEISVLRRKFVEADQKARQTGNPKDIDMARNLQWAYHQRKFG